MTEGPEPSPTDPRAARRRVLVVAVAVVLVAAGTVGGVLFYGGHQHHRAAHPTTPPSATASGCGLRVINKGFNNIHGPSFGGDVPASRGEIHVGYVVANPCRLAAVNCQFTAVFADAAGNPVPLVGEIGNLASATTIGVIRPGQQVGVASQIGNTGEYDASKVVSLAVTVAFVAWQPVSDLPDPQTATAENIAVTARNGDGYVGVTYLLKQGPDPVVASHALAYTLLTDDTGRIVAADAAGLRQGQQQSDAVWIPPGITAPHAQVWIVPNAY